MILSLLRKDFMIGKIFIIITFVVIAGWQLLFVNSISPNEFPTYSRSFTFLASILFGVLMIFSYISQYEFRYPKTIPYLCSMPHSRCAFVIVKYIELIFIFLFALIVNIVATLIFNPEMLISISNILATLMITVIVFGTYLPVDFKYGYTKSNIFILIILFLMAVIPSIYYGFIPNSVSADMERFLYKVTQLQTSIWCLIFAAISIAVFFFSMSRSIKIFENKEL